MASREGNLQLTYVALYAIVFYDIDPPHPWSKAARNAIDVYLQPLIDELKLLWCNSIRTYDAHRKEFFTMYAALLWTINNFPAYANLSR